MGSRPSHPSTPVAHGEVSDSGQIKTFHIFGSGISFSISPVIHNAGFQHHQLPFNYDIRESSSIEGVAHLIRDEGFGGASVTMPHKLQVHKYCDEQTDTANSIGAINTLIVRKKGDRRVIVGDNTDCSGLYNILHSYTKRTQQSPKVGLVIGAGGASRAALYALNKAGIQTIYLVNRTLSVAEDVREAFRAIFTITVVPSLTELPENPDIIIGTVPADATTEKQFTGLFGVSGLCVDMAYKPRQTPLLTVAQRHPGWETVTGLQVLLAQAFDQYRLWTGLEAPEKVMTEAVAAHELKLSKM